MALRAEHEQRGFRSVDAAGRRALLASFLGWMFDGYETYALVLVAAVAARQLVPPDQLTQLPIYIGGMFAVTLFGWATGGVAAGILADYIGRKRMLMISILWYALFTGLSALAPSYALFVVLRFLTGLGLGAEWGPGTAIVGEFWPPHQRGRAAGVLQSAFGVGFLLATIVWAFVAPLGEQSWRLMFLIGILPALVLLWIRTSVRDPELWMSAHERRQEARRRAALGQATTPEDQALLRFTMLHVLATPELRRRLIMLLAMSLTTIVAWWAVSTWIPQYGAQIATSARLDPQQWSQLTAFFYNVAGIAGYVALGYLADLWGRKPTICFYFLGSLPLTLLLFLVVRDPVLFLVVTALNGFFTLGQFSWLPVYLPEVFPTAVRGSAISLVFDTTRYLAAFGPLLAGWLIATLGGIANAAAIISMIYILGLVVTPFAAPETKGKPLPE